MREEKKDVETFSFTRREHYSLWSSWILELHIHIYIYISADELPRSSIYIYRFTAPSPYRSNTFPVYRSCASIDGVTLKVLQRVAIRSRICISFMIYCAESVVIERSSRILDRPCTIHGSLILCYTWSPILHANSVCMQCLLLNLELGNGL